MTGLGRVPVAYGRIITCEARSGISQPLLHFPDALLLLNGGSTYSTVLANRPRLTPPAERNSSALISKR